MEAKQAALAEVKGVGVGGDASYLANGRGELWQVEEAISGEWQR